MFKLMLLKLSARLCPLAERLGTSQGRNITYTKEVTLFPDYFFSGDYDFMNGLYLQCKGQCEGAEGS